MIGLDTTAIIDLFKGDPFIKKILDNSTDTFYTTIINHQEIMIGINSSDKNLNQEIAFYHQFFDNLTILPMDIHTSAKASDIFWNLKKKGKDIGKFDCIIASILQSHGVEKILTKNVRHFKEIPSLKVVSY